MLICGFKQSIALTRKTISKSHHYAIRNVRRAIRTEMANKRGFVNWYQPDFHMSEKSQTKRNFYCFPIKKDIRPFSAESSQFAIGERKESRASKELVPSNNIWVIVKNSQCECDFFCLEWSPSHQSGVRPTNTIHLFSRFILDQLYPTHVRGGTCYLAVSISGQISSV